MGRFVGKEEGTRDGSFRDPLPMAGNDAIYLLIGPVGDKNPHDMTAGLRYISAANPQDVGGGVSATP